jgi:hypothetical protein
LQGLALLAAVAPAIALTPAELRAMRESQAKAHRLEQQRYGSRHPAVHPRAPARVAPAHSSKPAAAPPSNLGGHVTTHKGIKEWHTEQRSHPKQPVYYTTAHNGNPYVDMKAAPAKGVLHPKPHPGKLGVRVTPTGSGDPDTPTTVEQARWGGVKTDARVRVPEAKRMKGDYEREGDGSVRVRPEMHHDVLGNYEQRTWAANKDAIVENAEEEFLKHESPMAVHDCGLDGDDCNYKGTGVEGSYLEHDRGTYMKARTQSLAQVSWLPDCSTVNCATEIKVQHHRAAAAKAPQVLGAGTTASVQAQLAYDHATDERWSSRSARGAAAAPVEKVELSHKDIDLLAKELYKEATAADRKRAESSARARESQIRNAVTVAASPVHAADAAAPLVAAVTNAGAPRSRGAAQPLTTHRVRAAHTAHRRMLLPQRGVLARRQGLSSGEHKPAVTAMPQGWPVDGYEPGKPVEENNGWPVIWPVSSDRKSINADVPAEGAMESMDGRQGEEGVEEAPEAGVEEEEEQGVEGAEHSESEEHLGADGEEVEEAAAPAPLTYLVGACCDSEGHCKKCPGPDEDYNMWDNIYIFPGDETGMGRSFMHVCLAVLFIILVVLVCTFILDKRKEETGQHPLDGLYQNAVEFGETTQNR